MTDIANVVVENAVEATAEVATEVAAKVASSPSALVVGAAIVGATTVAAGLTYGIYRAGRWGWRKFRNRGVVPAAA